MEKFHKNNGSQPVVDGTPVDTIHESGEINYGVLAGEESATGSHPSLLARSWRKDPDLPCTITHWRRSDTIMDFSYTFDAIVLLAVIAGLVWAVK